MAGVLFEDIFNVKDIDPEGKKFDRGEYRLSYFKNKYLCVYVEVCCHILSFYWYLTLACHMATRR